MSGVKRIAYMTGEYPRATDTFIQREVAALRRAGVEVDTFSIRRPHDREAVGPEQQAEGERTTYLLPFSIPLLFASHLSLLFGSPIRYVCGFKTAVCIRGAGIKALIWNLAYFLEAGVLARHLRKRKITHLHNHFSNSSCSVAMIGAELGRFTFSFTVHGPQEFFEPKYWQLSEKVRRAKFVNCISEFCRSQVMIFSPQDCWGKLRIVHCGVRPTDFLPVEHSGIGNRLLFVGRLAAVKGLPVLLDALAKIRSHQPDVKLCIAGDGPDRARLATQAKSLGIEANVEFLGYQSQSQVRQLLQQTDVFVMSSFAEGVPVVLMEAMAAGVPVVATRIAGIPELVEDGVSGYLVPPGEADAIVQRVMQLFEDADLRSRFGRAGKEKVCRDFDVEVEAQKMVGMFMAER